MKRRRGQSWGQVVRRGLALGMALVVLWIMGVTADFGAVARTMGQLGTNPDFVAAALRLELGAEAEPEGPLSNMGFWQQMVVRQSTLLRGGQDAVTRLLSGDAPPEEMEDPGLGEEEVPLPDTTAAPDDIIERTLGVSSSQHYDSAEGVYIYNRTEQPVDVAVLAASEVDIALPQEGPQILIMHTHGSEAYTPDGADVYEASDPYRTTDNRYNMVRVGEEIAEVLEEAGFTVLHDTTLYDYPDYNEAYDRSLAGVQALLEEYPTIRVVMDVHRDALGGEDGTIYKTMADVNGERTAQVMLVMGSNDNGLSHDHWKENLTLAVQLQLQLNEDWPTFARPISLRAGRYNQQLTTGSILVEVGSHGNTLQEALGAARRFAQSAAEVLSTLK